MQDVSKLPVLEKETRLASNGGTYISKVVYSDAYWQVTVWYNESGAEIRRIEKELD